MKHNTNFKGKEDIRYKAKKLYQTITNQDQPLDAFSLQKRVNTVRYLENIQGTQYRSTRDMRRKIEYYLKDFDARRNPIHIRLRRARKKKKLTQLELANRLGYKSHVAITQFEKGLRYPSDRVICWLEKAEM